MPDLQGEALGRLLLDLLTRDPGALPAHLAPLSADDWAALLRQARYHRVGPLLARRLQPLGAALPSGVRERLQADRYEASAAALQRRHELQRLARRLAAAPLAVIVLKGGYLAETVYAEPGLRPMSDLDLLFRQADLPRVQDLLLADGYGPTDRPPLAPHCARHKDLPLFVRPGATPIEVHWHLEPPGTTLAIDLDGLWARARPWPTMGATVMALTPEDLLLHLCLHLAHHHRFAVGLASLFDLARVGARFGGELDWTEVTARARRWRAASPVYLALRLAQDLVGAAVPAPVLAALHPPLCLDPLLADAAAKVLAGRDRGRRQYLVDGAMLLLNGLEANPGGWALPRLAARTLFPPPAILAARFPRWQGAPWRNLLYAVHWLVMLHRYRRLLWRWPALLRRIPGGSGLNRDEPKPKPRWERL